ncbi:MAG: hypothetical protein LBT38_06070 [Deltaproteobacteria bacterium]|jgi:hypothetical protein|nr:hypothetical protein [Deltaproteobacteria bacterium]
MFFSFFRLKAFSLALSGLVLALSLIFISQALADSRPLAYWSEVKLQDSPFPPHDRGARRLFKLKTLNPSHKPTKLEIVVKKVTLKALGPRRLVAAEPRIEALEPLVHEGAYYALIIGTEMATIDLFSRAIINNTPIYSQTKFSIYPPKLAGPPEVAQVPAPIWPRLAAAKLPRPFYWVVAGSTLSFELEGVKAQEILGFSQGELSSVLTGEIEAFDFPIADDQELNDAGLGASREKVIFADLGDSGFLSFSVEANRNIGLHQSRTKGVKLLFLTMGALTLGTIAIRRRGHDWR